MVPGRKIPRKMVLGKNGPRKIGLRKNVLQKLFSVKRMLGNLNNFFIFIDWFHYTHEKMFDVHLTILHAPNCRTLKKSRKVCCWVLGFHRWITSEHFTRTHHDAWRSPYEFLFPVFEFSRTIFPGTIFRWPYFRDSCSYTIRVITHIDSLEPFFFVFNFLNKWQSAIYNNNKSFFGW